jgi:MFS family permease
MHDFNISPRKFASATLLTSGTLAWFFLLNTSEYQGPRIFQSMTPNDPFGAYLSQILFFSSAVFWSILGSFVGRKTNRRKFLFSWILIGVIITILLPFLQGTFLCILCSVFLGLSLGLGLPSSLSFIAETTVPEERGRVSGIIIFLTFVMAFSALVVARILGLGLMGTVLLSAVLRSTSFFALVLDGIVEKKEEKKTRLRIGVYRDFLLYLIPWVLFNIAAGLSLALIPIQDQAYASAVANGNTLRYICIAIFGLVAGSIADRFGRKQIIIIGLTMLGTGFALLGFNMSPESTLIYLTISGVAWGSFLSLFIAVPGDLSIPSLREKFYAIGTIMPLAILLSLYTVPIGFLSGYPAASISQILSLIIFLSIIPVLRAKETLPKSRIIARRMREHIYKVEKLIQESKKEKS